VASGGSGEAGEGTATGGTGGATSVGGTSSSGGSSETGGTSGTSGYVDPNCYPPNARNGAECTQPCTVTCGFGDLGTRTCECVGGQYSSCTCPRPPEYQGAPTAPYCTVADGSIYELKNTLCAIEWAQCIGTDPVEGEIPRGCVCMKNRLNGDALTWFCGSTSRWFRLE